MRGTPAARCCHECGGMALVLKPPVIGVRRPPPRLWTYGREAAMSAGRHPHLMSIVSSYPSSAAEAAPRWPPYGARGLPGGSPVGERGKGPAGLMQPSQREA